MENNLEEFFQLDATKELARVIDEYVVEKGSHPFLDIHMEPDSETEVQIDIEKGFEEDITEKFKDSDNSIEELLSDYFSAMIMVSMKELRDLEDLEETQETQE